MIKLIAAADDCFGIGRDGRIPWHLPEDLKYFAKMTRDSIVVMGRGTADSLPAWLPGRCNIVVTRNMPAQEMIVVQAKKLTVRYLKTIEDALAFSDYDCWVIGGENVYNQTIDLAERIYLTHVHGDYGCDRFFPEIPEDFIEVHRKPQLKNVSIPHEFLVYQRL